MRDGSNSASASTRVEHLMSETIRRLVCLSVLTQYGNSYAQASSYL